MFVQKENGFTLLELFIAMGIIVIIASLTIPIGINFYKTQLLDEVSVDVLSALRRASAQASYQKNDSAFGMKFLSGSYVLFQGSSYATRTISEDEEFFVSGGTSFGGINEVVFSKYFGLPGASGTITLSLSGQTQTLYISTQGRIERQ